MNIPLIEPEVALSPEVRAAVALNASKTEMDLRALAVKHTRIVEIKDKAGRDQAHGAAMEVKRTRTAIEHIAKEARDDATKFSKAVIQEQNRLIAIIHPEEVRLTALRDEWDAQEQAKKEAAAAAERARVLAITERIATIKAYAGLASEARTAERVTDLIAKVAAIEITDAFAEFEAEAIEAKRVTLEQMEQTEQRKLAEEAERARIKAEQEAEANRLAAERAELERLRAEQQAANAARAAQEAAAMAQIQKEKDELQAQRDAFLAEIAAAQTAETQADSSITGVQASQANAPEIATEAPEEQAAEPTVEPPQASDAQVIWFATTALMVELGYTRDEALARLAAVNWTV